jgi:hypothetical protein
VGAQVLLVVVDEELVAEAVDLHVGRALVGGEHEQAGEEVVGEVAEVDAGELRRRGAGLVRDEDEPPVAEAGDVGVVGARVEVGGLEGADDAPVGARGEVGGGRLDDADAGGGEGAAEQAVERVGVELAEREVVGVGEVDEHEVERGAVVADVVLEPAHGVGVVDGDAGVVEAAVVEGGQHRVAAEQVGHAGVEVDEVDVLEVRVL